MRVASLHLYLSLAQPGRMLNDRRDRRSSGGDERKQRVCRKAALSQAWSGNCIRGPQCAFKMSMCCEYGYEPARHLQVALSWIFKVRGEDPDTAATAVLFAFQTLSPC